MTAAAKIAEALTVHMVGVDLEPGDLPDGNVVVLTGSQDAVKAAAKLFGQQVKLSTDLADALAQENAKLKAMLTAEWFYPADGYDGETCCHDVNEVLDEHFFWDRPKTGQHVVEINVATSLPSIWAAVRFECECECECEDPDECDCDNEMLVTEHASEAEARAALGGTP